MPQHDWVSALLDAADVRWALLRRVPGGRPNGDVDVVVAPADAERAARALTTADFVRLPWDGSAQGHVRYDYATDSWQWLDLHAGIRSGRRRLPDDVVSDILARRRFVDGAWMLAPADEFWLLAAEILLNARPLSERYRQRLETLRPTGPEPGVLQHWLDWLAKERGLGDLVLADIARGDWQSLEARRRDAPESTAGPSRLVRGLRALRQPARQGLSLALLGPDGAGKSTAARQVVEAYPFPAKVIYMGIGGPPGKRRRRLPALIAMTAIGLLIQWRRYLAGRVLQLRGHLVVFDRYMEEIWLPQPSETSGIRRAGRRLRRALSCPPADIMIVLDSPGALMFERKAEHDPAWLESERQRYLQLAERIPGVVVVDNTRPQHELIRDINAILWARLGARLAGAFRHR